MARFSSIQIYQLGSTQTFVFKSYHLLMVCNAKRNLDCLFKLFSPPAQLQAIKGNIHNEYYLLPSDKWGWNTGWTYRWVKSLSPLKAYFDAVSILLLSMNLWGVHRDAKWKVSRTEASLMDHDSIKHLSKPTLTFFQVQLYWQENDSHSLSTFL